MDKEVFEKVAKALADPKRFEILQMIASSPVLRCSDVTERVCVSQPTVSHHVKELAAAGLIVITREAGGNRYDMDRQLLADYLQEVSERLSSPPE